LLQSQLGGVECGAVVKANAYGLGLGPVARRLAAEGCRRFFIADINEGVLLRDTLAPHAADATIYAFDGVASGDEVSFDNHNLVPVLGDPDQIARWAAHGRANGGRRAAIKLDTGMGRAGLTPVEFDAFAASPADGLEVELIMSHLACADEPDNPLNRDQLARFRIARDRLPDARASLVNSAGIFLDPDFHFDLARPGAALYGINCVPDQPNRMAQVVRLQAKILRLRDVDSEMSVGYGATRRVPGGHRLATVAMGYADGYPRTLSNCGIGYVGDTEVPVVGRISMDLTTFDVTGAPADALNTGDSIELIGPHYDVDDLARETGTIGYEILAGLGARIARVYLGSMG